MAQQSAQSMIGSVVIELTRLPEEDLPLVVEFVEYLKQKRQSTPISRMNTVEIVAEARRRAQLLGDVPRTEIVVRFQELAEQIRQQAIAAGTAVDGDEEGD